MMRIGSVGANMFKSSGSNQQTDAVGRDIQKQIADKQKQLQEISSDKNMKPEERMKKSQELQKEISRLNHPLRQHQMSQRMEQRKAAEEAKSGGGNERQFNGYTPVDICL